MPNSLSSLTRTHAHARTHTHTHRQCNGYVESRLLLTSEQQPEKRHLVTHYHYSSWPDFGTPASAAGFVEMVEHVGVSAEGRPIIVHCSAGLGRSGVFVAVHSALGSHKAGERVDIEAIVRRMRQQRHGMIQTPEQYRFCLEATAEALAPGEIPRTKSLPSRAMRMREPRPFSEPPPDQDTPRTKRRKLYLQNAIPPPPPYPPPYTEGEREGDSTPPKNTPPPMSPPPPNTTPPPPISLESSPAKPPLSFRESPSPTVIVTPPSLERLSDIELIQQKYTALADHDTPLPPQPDKDRPVEMKAEGRQSAERRKDSLERRRPRKATTTTPARPAGREPGRKSEHKPTKPATAKKSEPPHPTKKTDWPKPVPAVEKKRTPARKVEPQPQPKPETEGEPEVIKEDLSQKFDGFEVPEFREAKEEEEEAVGFEIGDDQVLESKPHKKPEVVKPKWKPKQTTTTNTFPWLQQQQQPPRKAAAAPKPEGKPPPRAVPPVVNREPEKTETSRPIGKLNIPAAFGGGQTEGQRTPSPQPSPSHRTHKKQEVVPEKEPVRPLTPEPVKQEKPVKPTPTFRRDPAKQDKPFRQIPETKREAGSSGDTPPVLRMIKLIERNKDGATPSRGPPSPKKSPSPVKPPTTTRAKPPSEPVKPVEQVSKPVTPTPAPSSPKHPATSGNVAKILATFQ